MTQENAVSQHHYARMREMDDDLTRVTAQRDRLREALQRIASLKSQMLMDSFAGLCEADEIARAALALCGDAQ